MLWGEKALKATIKRINVPCGAVRAKQLRNLAWQVFQYQYFEGIIVYASACDIPFYGAALALMLKNFRRSVVFFSREGQEADAAAWAGLGISGIFALGDDGLDLACRVTWKDGRLISPNYPQVGRWEVRRQIFEELLPMEEPDPFLMCDSLNEGVTIFYPGDRIAERKELFEAKGILIALQREENLQWLFQEQMPILQKLRRQRIPVVVAGLPAALDDSQLRRQLLLSGVIPAGDMTREAALVKLMWTLARTASMDGVRLYFGLSFAGEVTQAQELPML